jgi:hypothetical protein
MHDLNRQGRQEKPDDPFAGLNGRLTHMSARKKRRMQMS